MNVILDAVYIAPSIFLEAQWWLGLSSPSPEIQLSATRDVALSWTWGGSLVRMRNRRDSGKLEASRAPAAAE